MVDVDEPVVFIGELRSDLTGDAVECLGSFSLAPATRPKAFPGLLVLVFMWRASGARRVCSRGLASLIERVAGAICDLLK